MSELLLEKGNGFEFSGANETAQLPLVSNDRGGTKQTLTAESLTGAIRLIAFGSEAAAPFAAPYGSSSSSTVETFVFPNAINYDRH